MSIEVHRPGWPIRRGVFRSRIAAATTLPGAKILRRLRIVDRESDRPARDAWHASPIRVAHRSQPQAALSACACVRPHTRAIRRPRLRQPPRGAEVRQRLPPPLHGNQRKGAQVTGTIAELVFDPSDPAYTGHLPPRAARAEAA